MPDCQQDAIAYVNENDMSNTSRTNWARIDAMSDEEIDTSDIPPLSDEFFAKAKLRLPSTQATVAVRVDPTDSRMVSATR